MRAVAFALLSISALAASCDGTGGACNADTDCHIGERCVDGTCAPASNDAGPQRPDAGFTDAGDADAGFTDAGDADAGFTDAGDADAGFADAGNADAGDVDAGQADAGPIVDPCGTHDEDNDGVGDLCDNCPTVANFDQADDGEIFAGGLPDGVGDVCDPRPADEGDAIAVFDPFVGSTLDPAWNVSGTWVVHNDVLDHPTIAGPDLAVRTDFGSDHAIVETAMIVDDFTLGGPNNTAAAGALMSLSSLDDGRVCFVLFFTGGQELNINTMVNGIGTTSLGSDVLPDVVGARHILRVGVLNGTACTLDTGADISLSDGPSGGFGLRANLAAVRYEYFLVYLLGP